MSLPLRTTHYGSIVGFRGVVMMARFWLDCVMQKPDEVRELAWVRRVLLSGEAQAIREGSHLTTGDVARAIEVTPMTVWRYEKRLRVPRGQTALRYGRFLRSLSREQAC